MSLYHLLEGIETSDLDDLANQIAEYVEARHRTENAVHDQELLASADAETVDAGAREDELTADLAKELARLFPQLRMPLQPVRSAA